MLDKLNPRNAKPPNIWMACSGAGRRRQWQTRVITAKIAYLIQQCGMDARNIAAITFTNKAAREMQERVEHLVKARRRGLTVSTFHSLGMQILRQEHAPRLQAAVFGAGFGRQLQDRFDIIKTTDKAEIPASRA